MSRPEGGSNPQPSDACSNIWAIKARHLLSHVFEYCLWWYRYFWSKVNIWNVNCAWATEFIFDTRIKPCYRYIYTVRALGIVWEWYLGKRLSQICSVIEWQTRVKFNLADIGRSVCFWFRLDRSCHIFIAHLVRGIILICHYWWLSSNIKNKWFLTNYFESNSIVN